MSYTIERSKRVLSLKTDDKRFAPYHGEFLLFVSQASCNNVSPRHYDWSVIAHDHYSVWNGNVQVPTTIWKCGEYADGGGIKPWGKEVSGVNYVKAWKTAVKNRTSVDGWEPRVSLWVGDGFGDAANVEARAIDSEGAAKFGGDNDYIKRTHGPEYYEAFKRLFPRNLDRAGGHSIYVNSHEQLLDALFLYYNRDKLPFSFYLSDGENAQFFKKPEAVYEEVA